MDPNLYSWVVLPALIFVARVFDQSIGTLRLIFAAKGYKSIVPLLGFFEVLIWIIIVAQVMQHLDNFICYIAYAAGFATGNYIGMLIEERLSIGTVLLRVIPQKDTTELISYLRENNFGVTAMDVEGMKGPLKMFFTVVRRKDAKDVVKIIKQFNPNAFYSVEEVRAVKEGYFKPQVRSVFNIYNPFTRPGK